ncbi:MAG: GlxA family transcriptional regulator [Cypionkella sp.]|uniref:GlxA family transcriptional regulator n=1 Tax=Cypionkella sp. TaxID=2811411 RepID=UPI002ABD082E|nr:GlxA family transcriptional regulator [Cypionkella sp.]MDZ4309484.1 GlxA family transcriptional regulator [Cypionkella sp.]
MIGITGAVAEIGLLIYPDCQLAAIYGLTDLFRIAGEWTGDPPRVLRVSHWQASAEGVVCVWDSHPGAPHRLSHVIAPPSIIMPELMAPAPEAARWLREQHAAGTTLCSVCAGAFVLAETGLIDGRRVTTHWAFAQQLAQRFPKVHLAEQHMVLDEGDIMTAGGILAWADLGLTLVQRLLGPSTMLATARFLLIEPPRHSQRAFAQFIPRFDHGDDAIRQSQHHIHAHATTLNGVADLQLAAGMTGRTFLRRFSAATGFRPVEYLQQVRIAKAREALEHSLTPVDRIAWDVGYADPAAFRKLFQKLTGLPPAAYRQRFGIASEAH